MYEQTATLVKNKFKEHLLPTMLTTMALSLASMVDGIIVGQLLGSEALAAIGLSSPIIYCINILYVLFGVGGMTCVSIARGRWETEKADRLFTTTFVLGLAATGIFVVIMIIFMMPICTLLADGDMGIASMTAAYLRPLVFTAPALLLSNGMALFMRADGNPKGSAMIVLFSNVVNLILDYVLIRYLHTGIMGAGLSTTLGYVAGIFVVLPYVLNQNNQRSYKFVKPEHLMASFREIAKTGLPKGFTHMASFVRSLVLNGIIMNTFGALGMSVMTILINMLTLVNVFVGGTGDTLLPIVGTLYGEQDYYGVRKTVETARNVLVAAAIGLMIFFCFGSTVIGTAFGVNTPEGLAMLRPALQMYAFYVPFYAIVTTLQNFYNTTGREKFATIIPLLEGFVYVCTFAFILSKVSPDAFWLCFALSSGTTLLTIYLVGNSIRKKESVKGLLLLREKEEGYVWNMTIQAKEEDAAGLANLVLDFCTEHKVDSKLANRIGIAIEEMAVAATHYAHGGKSGGKEENCIDVMIRVNEEQVHIRFRDNGDPFDPVNYKPVKAQGPMTDGVEMMKAMASDVAYTRQLGFNTTILTISR